jgi:uncharacterized phage protein (TIGR02216 family)
MAFGLGLLRLAPRDFWAMTPRELDAALAGLLGRAHTDTPTARATLTDLMKRYPDQSSLSPPSPPSPRTRQAGRGPG